MRCLACRNPIRADSAIAVSDEMGFVFCGPSCALTFGISDYKPVMFGSERERICKPERDVLRTILIYAATMCTTAALVYFLLKGWEP